MITVLSPQGVVRGSYENNMPESTPYFDDLFTDNLETMETSLRFSVPLESPDSEWLEGFSTVLYPDKDGNLRELTVINVWEDWSQEQPVKTAVCEDASIDSLLKTHTAPFVAGSLEEAIHGALAASDWQFILAADTLNIGYQLIEVKEYSNVRSVLETIRQAYGIEYRFVVKFDGARITRQLQVYKEYGQHTGKYFIYNRDLTNIEREVDFSNVFTAALPYWIEDDAAQTIAGYTPRNPVKGFRKDYTMDNVQHIAAHDEFDRTDKSRMLIFKASSNNPELAYLEACNKLLDFISPTYTYTVNVLLLENILGFEGTEEIHLGDYVWLKEKVGDAEIGLEARVIQLTSSHTSPEQDEVVFTNFKEISVADSDEVNALRDLIQQIQEQQDEISEAVTQTTVDIAILQQGQAGIITDLEGKSSISIGDTPNPNPQQGDTWFADAVDPETGKIYSTIKVWNAVTNDWEPRYSAKDAEEALEAANEAAQAGADAKAAADAAKVAADEATAAGDEALAKVEQATVDINSAKDRINSLETGVVDLTDNLAATDALANVAKDNAALAQTAANTAQTAAQEAKAAADEAQGTANAALTSAGSAGTVAQEAKNAAANAQTAANNAKEAANTAGINAQKAIEDAQTAFDKAETNGGKIQEVVETVDGISTTVASVKTTADSALSKATTVETTANGVKTTVAQVQEDLEATDARVTTNETSIGGIKTSVSQVKTTADSALSKATTTETTVNGLKTTITSVETTANSALTKANTAQSTADGNKTTIASVKTTADSALTKANTVEQTVDGINTTLTSVQEDLDGNITKVNEISDTVDGHTASIKSVTTTANNALTKANTVETTVNGQKTTISSIQSDLSTNVTKVNQISDTVDGHTSLISSVTTTAGNALAKANTAQSTADGNTAKITAVTTTADSALSKANTLEETVDGVTRTITSVQESIRNVDYANYVPNSKGDSTKGYSAWGYTNYTSDGTSINITRGSSGVTFGLQTEYLIEDIVAGSEYTLQLDVKSSNLQSLNYVFIRYSDSKGNQKLPEIEIDPTKDGFQTITIPFTPSRSDKVRMLIAFNIASPNAAATEFSVKNIMVSKGRINERSWQPAIVDLATTTKVNTISDTVDGHTQLIASTKTTADSALSKATSVEQTANGLTTKITSVETTANSAVTKANTAQSTADGNKATIASVKTTADSALSKATTVETTVNGLKTTVSSVETTANSALTKATSVEQTASGIKTTVSSLATEVSKKVTDKKIRTSSTGTSGGGSWTKFANITLTGQYQDTGFGINAMFGSDGGSNSRPTTIYVRAKQQSAMGSPVLIDIALTETTTLTTEMFAAIVTELTTSVTSIDFYVKIPNNYTSLSMNPFNELDSAKLAYYSSQPLLTTLPDSKQTIVYGVARGNLEGVNGAVSQITQLSDQIDLRVTKNGVINAINVSTEGVVIAGSKVTITGDTTIANGIIKTAHIADANITTAKIANLAVGTAQIGAAAITEAKIGNLAVTTAKIADLAVTNAKIGSLSANKITTGTLDAGVISVINLNASNIKSGTLSGLRVESPYDVPIASGATSNRRGALVITDGYLRNVYQTYVRSSGTVTGNGELTLTHEALTAVSRTGASTTVADNSMQLHAFGLTLQNSAGQGGTLSFQDLYSQATTSLMPASGWSQYSNDPKNGNHPTVTRQGRLVTLAGAFSNNNQLPADNNSYTMTTIPVGYRPAQLVKWLAKGSGTSIFMITVESNGTLYINYRLGSASGGFGYVVNASGNLFNIAGSYSAADI